MNAHQLYQNIKLKKSYLCIGLDTDISKIPSHLLLHDDPVFEFNKAIIDLTHDLCVAYKPNIAFYESMGSKGWDSLQKTLQHIPNNILTIADAKRGDIGNTAEMYANTFFNTYSFDGVTIAPYMGFDSIAPFLKHKNKWSIVLALTSNKGSEDFQMLKVDSGPYVYEEVIRKCITWSNEDQLMLVVGATNENHFKSIRSIAPHHFFLVPGIGAQGGDLESVSKNCFNSSCGILVNASRSILYASSDKDFAAAARNEALKLQQQMEHLLAEENI
ncbi:MAG TPA: orotidine-5'-phosphate decarboxylase [Bacteroidia bacterium]|nr:orotidine-5'-phosphate decarboxylase [Bacteroidia bacterium]HNT80532.1 orotidine-5'-phosphate decarboxylase [Bacteroidia bacterium]